MNIEEMLFKTNLIPNNLNYLYSMAGFLLRLCSSSPKLDSNPAPYARIFKYIELIVPLEIILLLFKKKAGAYLRGDVGVNGFHWGRYKDILTTT